MRVSWAGAMETRDLVSSVGADECVYPDASQMAGSIKRHFTGHPFNALQLSRREHILKFDRNRSPGSLLSITRLYMKHLDADNKAHRASTSLSLCMLSSELHFPPRRQCGSKPAPSPSQQCTQAVRAGTSGHIVVLRSSLRSPAGHVL